MARPINIMTAGLKELQGRMKRLEVAIEPKDLNPLLVSALNLIRDRALENLRAFGVKVLTGNLEKSLITRASASTTVASAWTKAGNKTMAPHAHLIEFGHRIVGHKPSAKSFAKGHVAQVDTGKTVPARPFFRNAVDAMRSTVRQMVNDGIAQLLWDSVK
jgi:hypothetical protein